MSAGDPQVCLISLMERVPYKGGLIQPCNPPRRCTLPCIMTIFAASRVYIIVSLWVIEPCSVGSIVTGVVVEETKTVNNALV